MINEDCGLCPVYPEGTTIKLVPNQQIFTHMREGWEADEYQQDDNATHLRMVKFDNN